MDRTTASMFGQGPARPAKAPTKAKGAAKKKAAAPEVTEDDDPQVGHPHTDPAESATILATPDTEDSPA